MADIRAPCSIGQSGLNTAICGSLNQGPLYRIKHDEFREAACEFKSKYLGINTWMRFASSLPLNHHILWQNYVQLVLGNSLFAKDKVLRCLH